MLYEHEQGRSFVQGLRNGVKGYRIGKENNVLYVLAERVLSVEKMAEMEVAFTRIEELEVGLNKREQE